MTSSQTNDPRGSANDLLIEFLGLSHLDLDADFEDLCAAHADEATQLRLLYAEHQEMQQLLGVFGKGRGTAVESSDSEGARAGDVIGDFVLVSRVASGGQGEVWEAEQRSLSRRVALKLVLPYRINERTLALFAREARAGGRLAHPGIVAVHGYGEDNGRHWIAQEFVEGAWTLRDFIDEMRSATELPANYYQAVALFTAELADALQAAHAAGVIHRDVKPQNVLVTTKDHPKLTDFGLARITDESAVSVSGEIAGTWLYMSPEQVGARRNELDHRTDVFSLGVVMYEMLTLVRPFDGDTTHQIAESIIHVDPPDIRKIRSRVPKDLAVICGKALEKARGARFQSMTEFAADLRRHLANEPIHAKPSTVVERSMKWIRRNPTKSLVSAVAGVAFLMISGLGVKLAQSNNSLETTNGTLLSRTEELTEANSALESKTSEAEQNAERADAEAEEARQRTADVLRLSLAQDYSDLMNDAKTLWPVRPDKIERLRDWMSAAGELTRRVPELVAKRDELRATAIPLTGAERQAERESHPEYDQLAPLRANLDSRTRALAVSRGEAEVEVPAVNWDDYPTEARGLDSIAWELAGPNHDNPGSEALGLALSLKSLELAVDEEKPDLLDTTAWAYLQMGDYESAVKFSLAAKESAPEEMAEEAAFRHTRLEAIVARVSSPEGVATAETELAALRAEWLALEAVVEGHRNWTFFREDDAQTRARWWHNQLSSLIERLGSLADEESGLMAADGVSSEHSWSIGKRLAHAERFRDDFAEGGEHAQRWQQALPLIRAAYPDLQLKVQAGLVPLGADPDSGLWEFWDVLSGTEPTRGEDGVLRVDVSSGLVFVLLPAGPFWMGSQAEDPVARNYCAEPGTWEGPVHEVYISSFFLSKYEMSQGQWLHLTGYEHSNDGREQRWSPEWSADGLGSNLLQPASNISWTECSGVLERWGWQFPSEAQWEYGCRAGTTTAYWSGSDAKDLQGFANVADSYANAHGAPTWAYDGELDDGFTMTAGVHTFLPNGFGLHHMHGNVSEWCLDGWSDYYPVPQVDPVYPGEEGQSRMYRGGAYSMPASHSRSAVRESQPPVFSINFLGLRPARLISE